MLITIYVNEPFSRCHFWDTAFSEPEMMISKCGTSYIECCKNNHYESISVKYFRNCFHITFRFLRFFVVYLKMAIFPMIDIKVNTTMTLN